jgi:hypothetical protein
VLHDLSADFESKTPSPTRAFSRYNARLRVRERLESVFGKLNREFESIFSASQSRFFSLSVILPKKSILPPHTKFLRSRAQFGRRGI